MTVGLFVQATKCVCPRRGLLELSLLHVTGAGDNILYLSYKSVYFVSVKLGGRTCSMFDMIVSGDSLQCNYTVSVETRYCTVIHGTAPYGLRLESAINNYKTVQQCFRTVIH